MPERGGLAARPHAPAVGGNNQDPPSRCQNAPSFPQSRAKLVRAFKMVHQQQPVDGRIGQRQAHFIHKPGERAPLTRPVQNALLGGHQ